MSAVTVPRLGAAGGDLPGLGPAGDIDSGAKTGQVAQASQIVPMAGLNPDGSAAAAPEEPPSAKEKGKKKQVVRRKKVQAAEAGDDARATVDMQINRPRRTAGAKRARKKKDGEKKRRARAVTPEGAEDEIIDQGTMTMGDLCKDLKTGKKFSKRDEIKQRVVDKKIKDKMAKTHPELIDLVEDDESNRAARQKTRTPPPNDNGIRMRVVDGQLVMDDTTAVLDRHQKGKDAMGNVKTIVEDEFSRITNNATFMKREKAIQWDYAATELFYHGLRQFGTDFESIAKMLRPRNRRQIKLKFTKEEKNYPDRINKALTGEKVPIDLEEWEKLTGLKLEDVSVIEAERARIDQEHAAEDAAHIAEYNAAEKQKKAEIHANRSAAARRVLGTVGDSDDDEPRHRARASGSSAPAAGTESAKENDGVSREASAAPKARRKTTKDRAKKRNINSSNGGGDEFEVLGEVASAPSARYVLDYSG
jgi:transcription factor TFIIIB component B''